MAAAAEPAQLRARQKRDSGELLQIFRDFIKNPGAIKYAETDTVSEAPIMEEQILGQVDVLKAVRRFQSNMSLRKTAVQKSLKSLLKEKAQEWQMEKKHRDDWVSTMTKRIRNICRASMQVARKGAKRPKWAIGALDFLVAGSAPRPPEPKPAQIAEAAEEPAYFRLRQGGDERLAHACWLWLGSRCEGAHS